MSKSDIFITPSQIPTYIKMAKDLNKSVYFVGCSGLGKSEIVNACANAMFPNRVGNNLRDIRAAGKDFGELIGLRIPTLDDDGVARMQFVPSDLWEGLDEDWEGIVFLDELSHADPSCQKPLYSVIQERQLEGRKLPDGAVICAAGNRTTDNGATFELLSPLANRLMVVNVEPDVKEWLDWAKDAKIHPAVFAHIKNRGGDLFNYEEVRADSTSFCTGRSWENTSDLLFYLENNNMSVADNLSAVHGFIGKVAHDFIGTYELGKFMPDIDLILDGKTKDLVGDAKRNISLGWYVAMSCIHKININVDNTKISNEQLANQFDNMLGFIIHNFEKEVEMQKAIIEDTVDLLRCRNGALKNEVNILKKPNFIKLFTVHTKLQAKIEGKFKEISKAAA